MKFVPLLRGGITDDFGTEGYRLKGEGEFALRVGETDLLVSYRDKRLSVTASHYTDPGWFYNSFYHTDEEIRGYALEDSVCPHCDLSADDCDCPPIALHDEGPEPLDVGPPGSGAVIIEYTGFEPGLNEPDDF